MDFVCKLDPGGVSSRATEFGEAHDEEHALRLDLLACFFGPRFRDGGAGGVVLLGERQLGWLFVGRSRLSTY